MAAVIEDDIRHSKFLEHGPEETRVGLIPDTDGDLILLESAAVRIDINAHYLGVWTQERLPELERAAFPASYLDHYARPVHKSTEVLLINRKIMFPFMDHAPLIAEEKRPKRHNNSVTGLLGRTPYTSVPYHSFSLYGHRKIDHLDGSNFQQRNLAGQTDDALHDMRYVRVSSMSEAE
ncbi:hypothetical protein ACVII1_002994 [Bradyrhizobium elkanii]|uniref:hypothetical protein n=1 Tax=Bradyrhizobium elkanii TaxID=29448 RepID=UPI003596CFBB